MKCPFCAEDIQDAAKKCRYCGEWLYAIDAASLQQNVAEVIYPIHNEPARQEITLHFCPKCGQQMEKRGECYDCEKYDSELRSYLDSDISVFTPIKKG